MRTVHGAHDDVTADKKAKLTSFFFTSRTEEWDTPQYVYEVLNQEFHFTLDVCATKLNRKCDKYFSKAMNGLKRSWDKNICWMNPPYGKDIYKWMQKAYEESCKSATVVCLIHSRTDTKWWHHWVAKADEVRFVYRRLAFGKGERDSPFPSVIVVFRNSKKSEQHAPLMKHVVFHSNKRARQILKELKRKASTHGEK